MSRHISNVPQTRGWEKKIAEGPPCVVLASPGFMNLGPSRELFELWAPDSRNGVIITGYSIEGTLARVSLILIYLRDVITYSMYILFFFNGNILFLFPVPELGKLKVPDV